MRREPWLAGLSLGAVASLAMAAVLVAQFMGTLGTLGGQEAPRDPARHIAPPLPSGPEVDPPLSMAPVPVGSPAERTGSVQGVVRDQAGRPVANASVQVLLGPHHAENGFHGYTDRRGRYVIGQVPVGRHRVRFVDMGDGLPFATQYNGGAFGVSEAPLVRVRHRQTARADARLTVGGQVEGTVRTASGDPTYGTILLERRGRAGWGQHGVAGSAATDGLYTVANVPPGSYRLSVGNPARGQVYDGPGAASVRRAQDAPVFEVADGATVRVDAVLGEPGRFVGRVVTPAGEPVAGARVVLSQDFEPYGPGVGTCCIVYPRSFEDTTAQDGTFSVVGEDAAIGTVLTVVPPRGTAWRACGTALPRAERRIGVAPGEVVERELVLAPGGTVGGVVTDQDGEPVARALVRAVPGRGAGCEAGIAARTDHRGRYRLAGLAAQDYRLKVEHRRHATTWVGGSDRAEARVFRVRPEQQVTDVETTLEAFATISGTVGLRSAEDGDGVGDVTVRACLDRSHTACADVQEDGTFRLNDVRPGSRLLSFRVWVGDHSPLYLAEDGSTTYDRGRAVRTEVEPGESVSGIRASVDISASMTGIVVDEDGAPREWVNLALQRRDGSSGRWTRVDKVTSSEQGEFTIAGLPGGFYRFAVAALDRDGAEKLSPLPTRPFVLGRWLAPGEQAEDVRVQLETSP